MHIPFIIVLILTSIVAVAYMVERGMVLRWRKVIPPELSRAVVESGGAHDLNRIRVFCDLNDSPLSRLISLAIDHLNWPKPETVALVETRARHEVARLERGLIVLEVIVGIAPLMGLVGTIFGLIIEFQKMGTIATSEQSAQFADGISLALWATFLGLAITIPTLVAWSYFSKKVETLAVEMESLVDEFLRRNYNVATGANPPAPAGAPSAPARSASQRRTA